MEKEESRGDRVFHEWVFAPDPTLVEEERQERVFWLRKKGGVLVEGGYLWKNNG